MTDRAAEVPRVHPQEVFSTSVKIWMTYPSAFTLISGVTSFLVPLSLGTAAPPILYGWGAVCSHILANQREEAWRQEGGVGRAPRGRVYDHDSNSSDGDLSQQKSPLSFFFKGFTEARVSSSIVIPNIFRPRTAHLAANGFIWWLQVVLLMTIPFCCCLGIFWAAMHSQVMWYMYEDYLLPIDKYRTWRRMSLDSRDITMRQTRLRDHVMIEVVAFTVLLLSAAIPMGLCVFGIPIFVISHFVAYSTICVDHGLKPLENV